MWQSVVSLRPRPFQAIKCRLATSVLKYPIKFPFQSKQFEGLRTGATSFARLISITREVGVKKSPNAPQADARGSHSRGDVILVEDLLSAFPAFYDLSSFVNL